MTAILVILTILALLGADAAVMALRRWRARERVRFAVRPMPDPRPPRGVFLDSRHGWVHVAADGLLRVGVDDFLAGAVGEIERVEAPAVGSRVLRGEPLIRLRARGRWLSVPSPAAGEVIEVNGLALADPPTVGHDPYGAGWVVVLSSPDPHEAIGPLRIGTAATGFLAGELRRLTEFLTAHGAPGPAPVLADGGVLCRGAVATLDDERWKAFEKEFLGASQGEVEPCLTERS